jgi:hypothetical protein
MKKKFNNNIHTIIKNRKIKNKNKYNAKKHKKGRKNKDLALISLLVILRREKTNKFIKMLINKKTMKRKQEEGKEKRRE